MPSKAKMGHAEENHGDMGQETPSVWKIRLLAHTPKTTGQNWEKKPEDDPCVWKHPYIATVINEPGEVPALGCINDSAVVNSEHVAAPNAFILVSFLSHVSYYLQRDQKSEDKTLLGRTT